MIQPDNCRRILVNVKFQQKGDTGKSAYQYALEQGFIGTEEEWIDSLKQPAIDAAIIANNAADNANEKALLADQSAQEAIEATQLANDATDNAISATNDTVTATNNANNATQDAITATNEANSAKDATVQAISDAQSATQLANQSATNANEKAGLADTAATNANAKAALAQTATDNANTATQAANEAATVANNAKGWQAIESIENYQGKELRYISGWQGGTGDEPTTNVGLYFKVGGGFTDDKELAVDFKGESVQASLIYTRDDYNQIPEPRNPNTLYFTSNDA